MNVRDLTFDCLVASLPFGYFIFMVLANSISVFSSPWREIFAKSGLITPPCGHPSDVAVNTLWSMTPLFNQALILNPIEKNSI
jgi:hypothetical protein